MGLDAPNVHPPPSSVYRTVYKLLYLLYPLIAEPLPTHHPPHVFGNYNYYRRTL